MNSDSAIPYGTLYIKYPNGNTETHPVYTTKEEAERQGKEKSAQKELIDNLPASIVSVWKRTNGTDLPPDGEIVIGIELSGTPLECRWNYICKRWEAFDFQDGRWYPVTLMYWTKCPI